MRILIALAVLATLASAKHVQEEPMARFSRQAKHLINNFASDFLKLFHEERDHGAFTPKNVAGLIRGASEETARMMPSTNVPMKMALGVGGVLLGLSAVGFGSQQVGRSLKEAYTGFDWRDGFMAMARDDFLERSFQWMNVQHDGCKRKLVCEVEQYAANKSTFKAFILRFLSKRHPGLIQYQDAVDNGLDNYDCAEIYDDCPHSFVDIVGSIPVDRLGMNLEYLNSVPWKAIAEKLQEVKSYLN